MPTWAWIIVAFAGGIALVWAVAMLYMLHIASRMWR